MCDPAALSDADFLDACAEHAEEVARDNEGDEIAVEFGAAGKRLRDIAARLRESELFRSEAAATAFLERLRWPVTPICPGCESAAVYAMRSRATGERADSMLWRCRTCERMYSVRFGTMFERSKIGLRHWLFVFWAGARPAGVTAGEIEQETGVKRSKALYAMAQVKPLVAGAPYPGRAIAHRDRLIIPGEWTAAVRLGLTREVEHPPAAAPTDARRAAAPAV